MAKKKNFMQKNKKELIIAGIVLLIIIGISYAWLTQTINSTNNNVIVGGNLQLTLGNESPIIKIGGSYGYAVPITDAAGKQTQHPYTFTITNNSDVAINYSLYLDRVHSYVDKDGVTVNTTAGNELANEIIRYSIMSGPGTISSTYTDNASAFTYPGNTTALNLQEVASPNSFTVQTIQPNTSINYQLRLWINENATNSDVYNNAYTPSNKAFAAKLRVEAVQYYDASKINSAGY